MSRATCSACGTQLERSQAPERTYLYTRQIERENLTTQSPRTKPWGDRNPPHSSLPHDQARRPDGASGESVARRESYGDMASSVRVRRQALHEGTLSRSVRRLPRKSFGRSVMTVAVLLVSALTTLARAQDLVDISGDSDVFESLSTSSKNRILGLPGSIGRGAITSSLDDLDSGEQKRAVEAYGMLSEYLEDVVKGAPPNCLLRDIRWTESLEDWPKTRGWKALPQACVSSTRQRDSRYPLVLNPVELDGVLNSVKRVAALVEDDVMEKTVEFKRPVSVTSFIHDIDHVTFSQTCECRAATALRVKDEDDDAFWFVLSGLTNENTTKDPPDWERQYINEYIGAKPGAKAFHDPLPLNILELMDNGTGGSQGPFATAYERWGGRVGLSALYTMLVEDSPALVQALEESARDVDQATDALTSSNIAILALPMVMNVVPVSLITDVSTFGILVYTILTDMLTTVPFIIKGFELLNMGRRRIVKEETWYTGSNEDDFILAETWSSSCRLLRVGRIGAAFLGIGFTIMILGVVLEYQTKKLRERLKQNGTLDLGPTHHLKAALLQRTLTPKIDPYGSDEESSDIFDPQNEHAAFEAQMAMRAQMAPVYQRGPSAYGQSIPR